MHELLASPETRMFAIGTIWSSLIYLQTLMVAKESKYMPAMAFGVSCVWGALVREMAVGDDVGVIVAYALGSAAGSLLSQQLAKEVQNRMLHKESE